MAHPARDEPDKHFPRPRLGEVELLDRERSAEFLEDGGSDLHASIGTWPGSAATRASHERIAG